MPRDKEFTAIALLVIAAVLISGLLGYYFAASTVTPAVSSSSSSNSTGNVVNLEIVPDFGGSGYDAFVLSTSLENGVTPTPASNTTAPGTNNNNITVSSGTTVTFVLTSIDTAVNQNFSGQLPTPFTVYNDTNSGVISSQYSAGQSVTMAMGHTFTISQLGVNVPIPPDTIVSFKLTFSKPGVYLYDCLTPCGPGMALDGYMDGYVIVK
jgi:heme/copper-type cytochrome/quinol oxidase subunit 2